ncbi:MAG: AsmA family protein [Acidobacteria bacterium]|nr:AsmA family protein [Acidobacteriota bacterium]
MPTSNFWNSFRTSRWFKPAIILAGVLVLLFAGLLALPLLVDINTYHNQIASQLEQKLGRKVSLGKMGLRVFPSIKVTVDDLGIGDDPQVAQADFVRAKSVRLQLGLLKLLSGKPEVSGIELIEPNLTLIKTSADKWNWSTLKPLQESGQDSAQPAFDLTITNGSFKLIDRSSTPEVEKTYTGVNVSLDDFSPRRSFDFVIGLTMPGDQTGKLELSGSAGPIDQKDSSQTPIDARLKMDAVELSSLEALAGMQSPHAGKLTADATISGKISSGLTAMGNIKAEQLRLIEGVEPAKQPVQADFKLTAKTEKKPDNQSEISLKLDQADMKLGNTAVSLTGQINKLPDSPTFDLQLKGDRMALDSLLESAYAFGFGPPPGTKASGTATVNLKATGDQKNFALSGQAEIRDLKFQSASLPQAIQISELKLTADPQTIAASPFRATLSKTIVDFRGLKISDYGSADKAPRAHLEISTNGAQVDDLLKIAESFGARPDTTGSGTANLTATVDTELGEKAAATQITGQGKVSGARLQPSSLKKPLEVANADLAFTGDSARIDNLQAQLGSSQANGWLSVKNFNSPALGFDLKANQLNVAELQAALADSGQNKKASTPLRGEGQIAVGKLILDSITATDVLSKVVLANNVITFNPLSLKLYGGSYQGSARIDQNGATPEIALNGKFGGLDINQFLSATSGQASSIYGRADGTVDIRGRNEAAGMAQSLTGNGFISITNGKFMSFDLMKQVEVLGKLANLPTGGAGSAFRSLKSNLRFDRGKLTTDGLQLVMDDMQVNGNGWMQLGNNPTVSYGLLAKISPALSKKVLPGGASNLTGSGTESGAKSPINLGSGLSSVVGSFFMDQGGIVLPLKMSGTLKQPVFGLDSSVLQAKAKDKLQENLKENLIDRFLKKPGEAQADQKKADDSKPAEKAKPADLLKGVLDKFKKKEKP